MEVCFSHSHGNGGVNTAMEALHALDILWAVLSLQYRLMSAVFGSIPSLNPTTLPTGPWPAEPQGIAVEL